MSSPISEDDLHAYADNRLDVSRLAQVEAWLASHPEERNRIQAWRSQSEKLHRTYDSVLDLPVPPRLIPASNASRWFEWRRLAAVAWLAVGGLTGYVLRGDPVLPSAVPAQDALPRMAAVAHAVYVPEVRHPVEVGADQQAHLVAWLSKRLGAPLAPPDLQNAGYHLIGGRLLPGSTGEVAQFMYEDNRQQRLTLYVQPRSSMPQDSAFRHAREGNIDVFYWVDGPFGYALSGSTGRDNMLQLATLVYRQLDARAISHGR
jgi:anti-sigma factor RsiW